MGNYVASQGADYRNSAEHDEDKLDSEDIEAEQLLKGGPVVTPVSAYMLAMGNLTNGAGVSDLDTPGSRM
ncbi:hypothetical protein NDU88_002758 [Pleurodeles waltl]|uniref:Uncharacterized protein n=1 Tax=Pleurodeles waltl TaxID=8319 RepID=A0AAV7UAL5_PLEWA|nr:hypothetical protein NDU88_002758 [Pleurodeles waltl]